jgi:hypothetical protein
MVSVQIVMISDIAVGADERTEAMIPFVMGPFVERL